MVKKVTVPPAALDYVHKRGEETAKQARCMACGEKLTGPYMSHKLVCKGKKS